MRDCEIIKDNSNKADSTDKNLEHRKNDEIPNEEILRAMKDAEKNVNLSGPFSTVEEMMESLMKEIDVSREPSEEQVEMLKKASALPIPEDAEVPELS